MVFQKRLDYGINGYQALAMPRATRSTRRRAKFQRRAEDNQMCAFDLLATIAGEILQEKENPTICSDTSSEKDQHGIVEDCQDANKPLEAELSDEGSCDKKCLSHLPLQTNNRNFCLEEFPHFETNGHSRIDSIVKSSSCLERFVAEKLMDGKSYNKMENATSKVKIHSSVYQQDSLLKLNGDINKVKDEPHKFENLALPTDNEAEMCSFEEPLVENPPGLISLGGNAKLSGYNDRIPGSSLSKGCDNIPLVNRDDDENSSGCTHQSSKMKTFRSKTCIGDNRISNILASKFRKVAEKSNDDVLSNSDGDLKQCYRIKKNSYKHQSSQMNIPFKKRKLFHCNYASKSNRFISRGSIYYPSENGINQDTSGSSPGMHKDLGMSSLEASQHQTLQCRGSHVKLRIKSFRVPELFIEVPETATVGSLKRTVMDAMTAVLGSGLHIGVILQGKKVRDDSKTLLQTGISHDNQLDALGFTLEPNSSQSLPIVCGTHSPLVPAPATTQPLIRYPSSPVVIRPMTRDNSDMLPEHQVTGLGNLVESDNDSARSPINASDDKGNTDSKELVTVPEMNEEELAMVPMQQKLKRSEVVLRRIRRPFSVDEVEALVEAVEKLGTGRWRDVKLCAFDSAKHRTYVDLKDKWKTLVHTARISPQQRRGEPVPQKLLDRVLTAHAYWSQQQTKQQNKQHQETTFFNKEELPAARGLVDEMLYKFGGGIGYSLMTSF